VIRLSWLKMLEESMVCAVGVYLVFREVGLVMVGL